MIAWDNFDARTTKVLCDQCAADITGMVNRYLDFSNHSARAQQNWRLRKQIEFVPFKWLRRWLGNRVVIMEFS